MYSYRSTSFFMKKIIQLGRLIEASDNKRDIIAIISFRSPYKLRSYYLMCTRYISAIAWLNRPI